MRWLGPYFADTVSFRNKYSHHSQRAYVCLAYVSIYDGHQGWIGGALLQRGRHGKGPPSSFASCRSKTAISVANLPPSDIDTTCQSDCRDI